MSLLALTRISNPIVLDAATLNANFLAIKSLVDDSLGGDNIDPDAELVMSGLTVPDVYTAQWDIDELTVIELDSNDGSDAVQWLDADGNVLLYVASDGTVTVGAP